MNEFSITLSSLSKGVNLVEGRQVRPGRHFVNHGELLDLLQSGEDHPQVESQHHLHYGAVDFAEAVHGTEGIDQGLPVHPEHPREGTHDWKKPRTCGKEGKAYN